MECTSMSLLHGLWVSVLYFFIMGHRSAGIFIGIKATFCEIVLGHCHPDSSFILMHLLPEIQPLAVTNNRYLCYKCRQPPFSALLIWEFVGCVCRPPTFTSVLALRIPEFLWGYGFTCQIWGSALMTMAMSMAINAHSKLKSYIREHSEYIAVGCRDLRLICAS